MAFNILFRRVFRSCAASGLLANTLNSRANYSEAAAPAALRPRKGKSTRKERVYFTDSKQLIAVGGKGGDGCVSFSSLWANELAGPDGADGGNGGHVLLQADTSVNNFNHVSTNVTGDEGDAGRNKDLIGKSAKHTIVKVPVGTIIRNEDGRVVGDLDREGLIFVAARAGAGGKGNAFFKSDTEQSPNVCEYGPQGERKVYQLELRSMADIGLIGFPNAGKSTLLNAITRASPKVAPYAFTTLRPHLGMVQYSDHVQLSVADLPGLIPDSHKNKGLGIQFLKHAERCTFLMFLLDASSEAPWEHYEKLNYELQRFGGNISQRPQLIVANKIDIEEANGNVEELKSRLQLPVIAISAKTGKNLTQLLSIMRKEYEKHNQLLCKY